MPAFWRAHWVQVVQGFEASGPAGCWLWSSGRVSPPFYPPFLLCSLCIGLKYGSISRFKGVFRGFWGCCVGLYGLGALRGLWGFCTREWLGGLKACGVFASVFIFLAFICCFLLLLLSRFQLPLLVLLSSACPLSLWLVLGFVLFGVVVSFSLSVYTQKKGRKVFLRPLFVGCG